MDKWTTSWTKNNFSFFIFIFYYIMVQTRGMISGKRQIYTEIKKKPKKIKLENKQIVFKNINFDKINIDYNNYGKYDDIFFYIFDLIHDYKSSFRPDSNLKKILNKNGKLIPDKESKIILNNENFLSFAKKYMEYHNHVCNINESVRLIIDDENNLFQPYQITIKKQKDKYKIEEMVPLYNQTTIDIRYSSIFEKIPTEIFEKNGTFNSTLFDGVSDSSISTIEDNIVQHIVKQKKIDNDVIESGKNGINMVPITKKIQKYVNNIKNKKFNSTTIDLVNSNIRLKQIFDNLKKTKQSDLLTKKYNIANSFDAAPGAGWKNATEENRMFEQYLYINFDTETNNRSRYLLKHKFLIYMNEFTNYNKASVLIPYQEIDRNISNNEETLVYNCLKVNPMQKNLSIVPSILNDNYNKNIIKDLTLCIFRRFCKFMGDFGQSIFSYYYNKKNQITKDIFGSFDRASLIHSVVLFGNYFNTFGTYKTNDIYYHIKGGNENQELNNVLGVINYNEKILHDMYNNYIQQFERNNEFKNFNSWIYVDIMAWFRFSFNLILENYKKVFRIVHSYNLSDIVDNEYINYLDNKNKNVEFNNEYMNIYSEMISDIRETIEYSKNTLNGNNDKKYFFVPEKEIVNNDNDNKMNVQNDNDEPFIQNKKRKIFGKGEQYGTFIEEDVNATKQTLKKNINIFLQWFNQYNKKNQQKIQERIKITNELINRIENAIKKFKETYNNNNNIQPLINTEQHKKLIVGNGPKPSKNKYMDMKTKKIYTEINPYNVVVKITRKIKNSKKVFEIKNVSSEKVFKFTKKNNEIMLQDTHDNNIHPASLNEHKTKEI